MAFQVPQFKTLLQRIQVDIGGFTDGTTPRRSVEYVLSLVFARISKGLYGYMTWILRQVFPDTADDLYFWKWAAKFGITQKPAVPWQGTYTFTGTNGSTVPDNTELQRADGQLYNTDGAGTIALGVCTVALIAQEASVASSCDDGQVLSLAGPVVGVDTDGAVVSTTIAGSDVETKDEGLERLLFRLSNPPRGGGPGDYKRWALEVPGVTRAWCQPLGMGAGTVIVRFMMDVAEAGNGGFPVGTDGVAAAETRAAVATGDQLAVANYIYGDVNTARQPVGALVYAVAPIADVIAFTIAHISTVSADVKAAINVAIDGVFLEFGVPGGVIDLSDLEAAMAAVPGTEGFVIVIPADNITLPAGNLPKRGVVTYT